MLFAGQNLPSLGADAKQLSDANRTDQLGGSHLQGEGQGKGLSWKGVRWAPATLAPPAPWVCIPATSSTSKKCDILSTSRRCHKPRGKNPKRVSHHLQASGRKQRTDVLRGPICSQHPLPSLLLQERNRGDGRTLVFSSAPEESH